MDQIKLKKLKEDMEKINWGNVMGKTMTIQNMFLYRLLECADNEDEKAFLRMQFGVTE